MKKIPLSGKVGKGKSILVDNEDYEMLIQHSWYLRRDGYVACGLDGKTVLIHRLIMAAKKGRKVDHINHDKLDNQKANLRLCTHSENMMNQRKFKGISKFKGVSFNKRQSSWFANITKNKKPFFLGYFDTEEEAAIAYNKKAKELFGEFAYLNEIKPQNNE
jgi:hypothetical protein